MQLSCRRLILLHIAFVAHRASQCACNRVAGAARARHARRRIVMYAMRRWSVRQARLLDRLYGAFERVLIAAIRSFRLSDMSASSARSLRSSGILKGFFFDCRMCGQCALSKTGMSCPMNCPKNIRNGPCGGVRADGNCEVVPAMRCVWIEAHEGNRRIGKSERADPANPALDNRLWGRSSWLRVARESAVRGQA